MSGLVSPIVEKAAQLVGKAYEAPLITSAERALTEDSSMAVKAFVNLVKDTYMKGLQYKGAIHNVVKDDFVKIAEKGDVEAKAFNEFHKTGVVPKDVETGLAAVKAKNIGLNLYNEANAVGIKTQPLIVPNYFPAVPKEGMFDTAAKRQEMIDHLVATKQARNVAHASQLLGIQQGVEAPMRRIFHPFESPRKYKLDPAMLRDDLGVYYDYLTGAAERIGRARVAGPQGEKLEEMLSVIRTTDGEATYQMARRIAAEQLGYTFTARPEEASWERGMKAGIAAGTLGLAPVANTLGGFANMITVMGLKNFVKGFGETVTNSAEAHEFGDISAASLLRSIREMKRLTGAENQSLLSKMSAKVLLNPAENMARNERWMRVLGANVGKTAAESEFSKLAKNSTNTFARRRLATLGIDVDAALRRGSLDTSDKAKAGFVFANKTMLSADSFSLPEVWRDSAAMRVLTMYKPFLFLQTKFVRDEIIKPAIAGDLRPLIWAAVTFPAFGEIAGDIKMLARGRDQKDRPDFNKYPADRVLDNIAQIGGFGVAFDVTNAMAAGTPVQTYSFLNGPVVSTGVDILTMPGKTKSQNLSLALRRIPVVGAATAEAVAPPKKRVPGPLQRGVVSKALGIAR